MLMKGKFFTLLLVTIILYTNAFAQPIVKTQKTIGGSSFDYLTSICLTKDGGLIVAGYSDSKISGEKTQNSRGSYDYWVVKLNSLQQIQWDKTIGGKGSDVLNAVQQTADGGYILGGLSYSNKSLEKTQSSRGVSDYWIIKLDDIGNIQWDKTIGGSGYDDLASVQQSAD